MPCKILIVDHNAVIRRALRSSIEQNPRVIVCGEVENGKRAVDQWNELHPDVVIPDWQMPVRSGPEAA
jgi:chemotaxis response regulator CheB